MERLKTDLSKYLQDLEINTNDLGEDITSQPSKVMEYGELYAEAVYQRDKVKERLEILESEIENWISLNWEMKWAKFPSESLRRSYIVSQEKHQKAVDELAKSNYNVNLLAASKSAFEHRKKALEMYVSLLIGGFHSEVKIKERVHQKAPHVGLGSKPVFRRKSTKE